MSNVKDYVMEYLQKVELAEQEEESKTRFTVTLSAPAVRRLAHAANVLGQSRSGLAAELIETALTDVEEVLNIKFEDENGKMTDYAKYVFTGEDREGKFALKEAN